MSEYVNLEDWAKDKLTAPIPCKATLIKYAKNGLIHPRPFKAGRCWRVEETARFVGMAGGPISKKDDSPRLKRILDDGTSP